MTGDTPSNAIIRQHADVIAELLTIPGRIVLDIGCGNGHISRDLARLGVGRVIGIDPGAKQLARALAAPRIGTECYVRAGAEALPLPTDSADVVLFFNSLHHVPMTLLDEAFAEAKRVLKPGGSVLITEPLAQGPQFELSKLINDETEVRAIAYEKIRGADRYALQPRTETYYVRDGVHPDFDSYRLNSTSVNPTRADLFAAHEPELRERFERFGSKQNDGYHFEQVMRVNLLENI
ncbi:MAG: class I SAM-dependent methyltransferase [Proteobacteria bacterium]|nr:class I SAM-dependent methyltransferase [Pseudomonadota bacterium]